MTVVPNTITVQGKSYREGVDLSPEDALRLFSHQPYAPLIHVPTQAEYLEVYDRLANDYDAIISIHASREILTSWQNARAAAQQVMGRCDIERDRFAHDFGRSGDAGAAGGALAGRG